MNLTCQHCKTRLNLADDKIPKGREATVTCPKCKEKIVIPPARPASRPAKENAGFQQTEIFPENRMNALVCIMDDALEKKTVQSLKHLGYHVSVPASSQSAIEKMAYHIFHLVILDEAFEQGQGMARIIEKMNGIDMSLRRRSCLVMVSQSIRTDDNMAALHNSVNAILNAADAAHMEPFLAKAAADHKNLYAVYNESLKLAGKA